MGISCLFHITQSQAHLTYSQLLGYQLTNLNLIWDLPDQKNYSVKCLKHVFLVLPHMHFYCGHANNGCCLLEAKTEVEQHCYNTLNPWRKVHMTHFHGNYNRFGRAVLLAKRTAAPDLMGPQKPLANLLVCGNLIHCNFIWEYGNVWYWSIR